MGLFGRKTSAANTATATVDANSHTAGVGGAYTIDPAHSTFGFVARHAMVTNVKGKFNNFAGSLHLDGRNPAASTATIDITM
ncbi:YceI family protein, partial [Streptomyces sp. NPDC002265]|uniref:YceI family protein n=1 Tax=Streptomyces sp. NPDC002265 TaxID=3154415 RepID=UPI00332716AC